MPSLHESNGQAHSNGHSANGATNGTPNRLTMRSLADQLDTLVGRLDKVEEKPPAPECSRVKILMAILAGISTPLLALAMSTMVGHCAKHGSLMAVLPFSVLACMLIVSTPHLSEAKQVIGWKGWQAWAFAIGLDAAITVSELLSVWGTDYLDGIAWVPHAVVFGAVAYSAALNTFVNLRHARWTPVLN